MVASSLLLALLPFGASAINVIQSNDDGWAEINIREFYYSLNDAGFESVISAPAENQSGTGSSDEKPEQVGSDGCQFGSCPANSPAVGKNASEPRFNYVNSFPVTSMRIGIQDIAPKFYGRSPDIAVAGPNVGSNIGIVTQFSGTVGAATEAAKLGFPAIAFSGTSGSQTAWTAPVEPYMQIYADLSTIVTTTLTAGGTPYLPKGIWLNVNYPAVNDQCNSASAFNFVLSRIYPAIPIITADDVETCGTDRLPTERSVVGTDGCYASISVGRSNKFDAGAGAQKFVLDKLSSILSCLPKHD